MSDPRSAIDRRGAIQLGGGAALGMSLGDLLTLQAAPTAKTVRTGGRAKAAIVLFAWGGISHIDVWDLKPDAGSEIRGQFKSISTSVPGVRVGEHIPLLAEQMHKIALVRSVHHKAADHRQAAYWNLTGHPPFDFATGGVQPAKPPSRDDWPCIGSQVARATYRAITRAEVAKAARSNESIPAKKEPKPKEPPSKKVEPPKVVATVSLSSQVLGKGRFSSGSFGKQNGYTNKGTVELIGMISASQQSQCSLTRNIDGPVGDFGGYVAGDSTAGDWGSDTHGRGGNLYLPGNGEANEPHVGFGCHANKFITFDLQAIRKKHFAGKSGHFSMTGFVGVNGSPSVPPVAAIQAGVWVDGKRRNISPHLKRDDRPHSFKVYVSDKSRYLTLAMLNGPQSTHFDDIAFRDVNLSLLTGDIPIEVEEVEEAVAETQMNEEVAAALPRAISIPYPLADRGLLYGQYGGFLGAEFDPIFVRPGRGNLWKGISPNSGRVDLRLSQGMTRSRFMERRSLLNSLEPNTAGGYGGGVDAKREQAMNMLMSPAVRAAFDVRQESSKTRQAYGNHICGQSALMARRLVESGVPLVTVNCSIGDLNGARGDNWDTHGNNFNRLKNDMLPPLDRAATALLTDLEQRGRADDVLVVILTEFGRTPRINKAAGRDHFPNCYSVAFAGGGIRGGQVYGSSNKTGSAPKEDPCGPNDLHATIFHALGINPRFAVHDLDDRPFPLTDGQPLPIFG